MKRIQQTSSKRNLLATSADDSNDEDDSIDDGEAPIWLTLTTKQHIVDQTRLKPSKIAVPHSLNTSPDLRICLITADPQRAVKDAVADPAFPAALRSRITRILGFTKLKDRYKTFEQRRELLSEHDIFLADDRIITRLPATLGKVFYKGTAKRPIPIQVTKPEKGGTKENKQKKATKDKQSSAPSSPETLAKEIEKAVDAVPVSSRPGTLIAVRVGLVSFSPEKLSENISSVVQSLIERHVVKGWRNVRGIHIKGQSSFAVPLWLADDLWTDSDAILAAQPDEEEEGGENAVTKKPGQDQEQEQGEKRKRNPATVKGPQAGARKRTKVEEAKSKDSGAQTRKSKLAAQKERMFKQDV